VDLESNLDIMNRSIHMNDAQYYTANQIAGAVFHTTLDWTNASREENPLDASISVFGIEQTVRLPNDQWKAEMNNWVYTSLSCSQRSMLR
jgi:hypothetical protein